MLATTRVTTYFGNAILSGATGFFFERDDRLYLVTSRHVVHETGSGHAPDRLEIELHTDETDLTRVKSVSLPLYAGGLSAWHAATDSCGDIDVAVIDIDRSTLPPGARLCGFTPTHLQDRLEDVEIGTSLLVPGFPLGFHDTVHHLPVVRFATVASSFGVRFQGQGFFLTDARTHRGTSGAPVVMRSGRSGEGGLPWKLLGVHSARMDMGGRDPNQDESLGLNCAWYADVLMALTKPRA
ncbi:serine protease [Aquabacterium sp.]|uniref:serine protease n=1 Tax=Aquabacterium sp. TaxID=1872578 RepID=UPI0035C76DEE